MRPIDTVIVHCTATQPGWMRGQSAEAKVDEIDRWHVNNGWAGFGYHLLIDRDGAVADGRPFEHQGAHARGHNDHSIGVVLVGGYQAEMQDDFGDHFTIAQREALWDVLQDLRDKFGDVAVIGHNDVAAKGCPGFKVDAWLREQEAIEARRAVRDEPDPETIWEAIASAVAKLLKRGKA